MRATSVLAVVVLLAACGKSEGPRADSGLVDFFPARDQLPWLGWEAGTPWPDGPVVDSRLEPDGGACGDHQGSCAGCGADQLCAPTLGGTCVERLSLQGLASSSEVLRGLALAFASCWEQQPGKHQLCQAIDACALESPVSEALLSTWVCEKASVTDFPSVSLHDAAKSIFACWTGHVYRPWWTEKSIQPLERGRLCLSYSYWGPVGLDRLEINTCAAFPP